MAIESLPEPSIPVTTPFRPRLGFLTSTPIIAVATVLLSLIVLMAIAAPLLAPHDPQLLAPAQRLKPSTALHWLGTDGYPWRWLPGKLRACSLARSRLAWRAAAGRSGAS